MRDVGFEIGALRRADEGATLFFVPHDSGRFKRHVGRDSQAEGVHPLVGDVMLLCANHGVALITVHSVVNASLNRLSLTPWLRTQHDLELLVGEVMVGLRIFCSEDKLPGLMLDLAALVERGEAAFEKAG